MWPQTDNKLYKKFVFLDFSKAFSFMVQVAMLAEKIGHHPTWKNTYDQVEFWLSTHDAGDTVTQRDIELADAIDELAGGT